MQISGGGGKYAGATSPSKTTSPTTMIPSPLNLAATPGNALGITSTKPFTPYNYPGVAASSSQKSSTPSIAPNLIGGSSGGGTSYSGGSLGTSPTGVASEISAPVTPPVQSFDQWKSAGSQVGDAAFGAEDASAEAQYQALLSQLGQQNANYLTDFQSGLRNLGAKGTGTDYGSYAWDPTDLLGAYGQAFQNQQNDFSGRGMMDSTFYGQALDGLNRRFDKSKNDMVQGLATTNANYAQDKTNAMQTRNAARDRALAEAYSRYTANYGA